MGLADALAGAGMGYAKECAEKKSGGITGTPAFFYSYFLLADNSKKRKMINWADADYLNEMLKYVEDPEMRAYMYDSMRNKVFQNMHGRSTIVNEIVGLIQLSRGLVNYGKLTLIKYLDTGIH